MSEKAYLSATWQVSLDCDCPHCGESVDLLDDPDFWDGGREGLQIGEDRDLEYVICPECGKDFECRFEY